MKSNPYREASVTVENRVEENQYRVGPAGLIFVIHPMGKIHETQIHHAAKESGVVFGITQILPLRPSVVLDRVADQRVLDHAVKGKEAGFETPKLADNWQYHTASSIEEKWPKVLSPNWLQDLING